MDRFEEIKKRLDREYMGVTDSCGQDVEWLISEVERLEKLHEKLTKTFSKEADRRIAAETKLVQARERIKELETAYHKPPTDSDAQSYPF